MYCKSCVNCGNILSVSDLSTLYLLPAVPSILESTKSLFNGSEKVELIDISSPFSTLEGILITSLPGITGSNFSGALTPVDCSASSLASFSLPLPNVLEKYVYASKNAFTPSSNIAINNKPFFWVEFFRLHSPLDGLLNHPA